MDGAARVAIYAATRIVHCYTLEVNYAGGRAGVVGLDTTAPPPPRGGPPPPKYGPSEFYNIGAAVGEACLELRGCNPWSRVPRSEQPSIAGLRERIMRQLSVEPGYRDAVRELRAAAATAAAPGGGGRGGGSGGPLTARLARIGAGGAGTVLALGVEVSITPLGPSATPMVVSGGGGGGGGDGGGGAESDSGGGGPVSRVVAGARGAPRASPGAGAGGGAVEGSGGGGSSFMVGLPPPVAASLSTRRLRGGGGGAKKWLSAASPVVPPPGAAGTQMPPLIPSRSARR
jgi:hypothetical protein